VKRIMALFLCLAALAAAGSGLYASFRDAQAAVGEPDLELPVSGPDPFEPPETLVEAPLDEYAPQKSESPARSAPVAWRDAKVLHIRDKFFIQQCNDIYLNPDEYTGRTVRLEGIYDEYVDEENGETTRYVIRYGPGCCGNDGVAGFEFTYDGEQRPKMDDWIEATGTVDIEAYEGEGYVVLRLSELKIMDKRGMEYVTD
jgi:uncharacterized membrane protein YcgQ (UPF0703/DUF1980 family)